MTGIILAGGKSRRMGTDKACLPWRDGTLLTATVDKLLLVCREVIVVGPYRAIARKVHWTKDRYVGKGPLAGLQAGLEEASSSSNSALVLPCDMPTVPVQVLEALVLRSQCQVVDMVIPVHLGGSEPLCAWYSIENCLPVIQNLLETGHSRLTDILPRVRVDQIEVGNLFPGIAIEQIFANLNSPLDYENARKITVNSLKPKDEKIGGE